MNRSELITVVSKKTELSKKDVTTTVDSILEVITETLTKGEDVVFTGFGTFSTSQRAARDGVNPATGKKIKIGATTVAKFKVGSKLKEAVKS